MATVYLTEFAAQGRDVAGYTAPAALQPPVVEQTVAIGGTSVASSAFNANTALVRVHTDAVCSIYFGIAPVATASTGRMAANATEYFAVLPGKAFKIAVITNS